MVKIVTGPINSYKTTMMLGLYQREKKGDGFIAKKTMKDNQVYGYTLVRLSNQFEMPLAIRDIYDDGSKEIIYKLGPYHFYKNAFSYIEETVDMFLHGNVSPIYLDEIGLLELDNKGYHEVLNKLLEEDKDLVLVIRKDLLFKVLDKYEITDFELI